MMYKLNVLFEPVIPLHAFRYLHITPFRKCKKKFTLCRILTLKIIDEKQQILPNNAENL